VIEILSKFIRADITKTTFGQISKDYLKSGNFFIDCLATFPTLLTGQLVNEVDFLKFLRLRDFFDMFEPFTPILEKIFPHLNTHLKSAVISFCQMIASTMLLAHFFACIWLFLGIADSQVEVEERTSWVYVNDFDNYTPY
jgi:hypothetical protein